MLNIEKDKSKSCYAEPVGYGSPYKTYHKVILNTGCFCSGKRTPTHELLHTLGFWHEHQRPDRDKYIEVDMTVVPFGSTYGNYIKHRWSLEKQPNEEKCNQQDKSTWDYCYLIGSAVKNFGLEYDYNSIMHYWDSQ